MGKAFIQESTLTDIADAIREKNGTNNTYLPSQMGDAILALPSVIEEKDVNFYDYDGTLIAAYTALEAQALTALPPLPDRTSENLTNEGWNWTLAEIKEQLTDVGGIVNVGCTYYTTDGKTHIFVDVQEDSLDIIILLGKNSSSGNDVIIDWNDGNITTVTSTTITEYSHTYLMPGYYDISIENDYSPDTGYIFGTDFNNYAYNLKKILVGNNMKSTSPRFWLRNTRAEIISLSTYFANKFPYQSFQTCRDIKHLTLPRGQETIPNRFLFYSNPGSKPTSISIPPTVYFYDYQCLMNRILKSITFVKGCTLNTNASSPNVLNGCNFFYGKISIPSSCTTISRNFLAGSNTVNEVTLHEGIQILDNSCFADNNLRTITIPSTVTAIGASAFARCYGLSSVYVKALVPPTIDISSFPTVSYSSTTGINPNCKFYVPRASLTAYQTATNWSDWAANMISYDY